MAAAARRTAAAASSGTSSAMARRSSSQAAAAAAAPGSGGSGRGSSKVIDRNGPNGPSSFPRRAPIAATSSSSAPIASVLGARAASSSSSSSSKPLGPGGAAAAATPDTMARRFTRFYTANFEKRPVATLCVTNSTLSTIGDACAQLIGIYGAVAGAPVGWDFARTLRFATFGFSLGPLIEKWNRFLEFRFPLRPIPQVFTGSPPPPSWEDNAAFAEKLKAQAEKEGFRVNMERGDSKQGQQFASKTSARTGTRTFGSREDHVVDPQTIAAPSAGGPGGISVAALFKRVAVDQLVMAPLGIALFITSMGILEGLEWTQIGQRFADLYFPILLANWQIWPLLQTISFRYVPLRYRVPFSASLGVLWTIFLSFKNAKAAAGAGAVSELMESVVA